MNKAKLLKVLTALNACDAAKRWVKQSKFTTATQLWNNCRNGAYMDWLARELYYTTGELHVSWATWATTPSAIRKEIPAKDLVAALRQVEC